MLLASVARNGDMQVRCRAVSNGRLGVVLLASVARNGYMQVRCHAVSKCCQKW